MIENWRARWRRAKGWRWRADRPYRLIVFALLPLVAVAILERLFDNSDLIGLRKWVSKSDVYGPLFFPKGAVDWKDRLQGIVLLLGLPVAFCLWHWRDRNVRDQIENQRKDINLKEFQEVQLRAAGALDPSLPAEAREQLQIAAIHQLRGFLRGEFGIGFQRPAFELFLAGHASSMARIGLEDAIWEWYVKRPDPKEMMDRLERAMTDTYARRSPIDHVRLLIMTDEWRSIFLSGFPLTERNFDGLNLSPGVNLSSLLLNSSTFRGSDLSCCIFSDSQLHVTCFDGATLISACFDRAGLTSAQFRGSMLSEASFCDADLSSADLCGSALVDCRFARANMEHALLNGVDLQGSILDNANLESAWLVEADLRGTRLRGACLRHARLHAADIRNTDFEGADLRDAYFDQRTKLAPNWDDLSVEEQSEARRLFTLSGAFLAQEVR